MLTKEDKDEIKELMQYTIQSLYVKTEAKFEIIDSKLESILTQTTKHNGRMSKIEDEVNKIKLAEAKHTINCPHNQTVQTLRDSMITNQGLKKWLVAAIGLTAVTVTLIITILKFAYNIS